MVEASKPKAADFTPSEEEQVLILQHLGDQTLVDKQRNTTVTLTKEEALRREALIEEVEYTFQLALNRGDYYLGSARINFYLKDEAPKKGELFINSQAMAITELMMNDEQITDETAFVGQKISLDFPCIQPGWNTVSLKYMTPYNKNSIGLYTFTDSKDDLQYLVSQFEAFHCFRVFPSFDQPSIKAKMSLTISCPKDWQAVSNGIETRYEYTQDKKGQSIIDRNNMQWFLDFYEKDTDVSIVQFEQTPIISTYLYAICAGPYRVFEDFDPMFVPQRIFARRSLQQFVRDEMTFGVTKTTLTFYQKHFGQRYPFSKVDHVFCPDYKYGAMENVGCITYTDAIMCNEKEISRGRLFWMCNVIEHELCHMWFGNLVTMKWWNDLWLNEAFATALSYKAAEDGGAHVDEFKDDAWLDFARLKTWGINTDFMPSNHNIQALCPDTDAAESLIDGITYGKGSAMIKQLIFLMDWETFTDGIKIYFDRYKWKNTSLEDFIGAMQEGYDKKKADKPLNLTEWSEDWLQTKGVNRMAHEVEVTDGKYTKFAIKQSQCPHADVKFRKQTINVTFYNADGSQMEKIERVNIENTELTTLEAFKDKKEAKAVLLNSDDWGYGHFMLDDESIKIFEKKFSQLGGIDKSVVSSQIINMMRQLEYPAIRLSNIRDQLLDEKNQTLISSLNGAFTMAAFSSYLPEEDLPKFKHDTAQFWLKKAKKDKDDADLSRFCITQAISFILQKELLAVAASWLLNGKVTIDGEDLKCELTDLLKYSIVKKYWCSTDFTLDEKKALKEKAFSSDDSDAAKKTIKVLDWCLPDAALKEKLWAEITDFASTTSLLDDKLKVEGFFKIASQPDLMAPYHDKYLAIIEEVVEKRDREFAQMFINNLSHASLARDSDETAFKALLDKKTHGETHFFTQFLKKQVEYIDIAKKARALCETYKAQIAKKD